MARASIRAVVGLLACWIAVSRGAAVNTYVNGDGKSVYYSALFCNGGFLNSAYLQYIRSTYTTRDNAECCFLEDSRNSCCLNTNGSTTECRCSQSVTCG
ncbi:unnamed protein product, partial [Lymnaea stagnalis]